MLNKVKFVFDIFKGNFTEPIATESFILQFFKEFYFTDITL